MKLLYFFSFYLTEADLYYLHRMSGVPVEKVAEAMGRLIDDGLIRGWGLSQVDVDVIERAQKVTPLAAIQNIYSMVERDSEAEIIPYCMEQNIGFVPFSPIASGFLSGKITPETQFERKLRLIIVDRKVHLKGANLLDSHTFYLPRQHL